jgi:hypothetical protein
MRFWPRVAATIPQRFGINPCGPGRVNRHRVNRNVRPSGDQVPGVSIRPLLELTSLCAPVPSLLISQSPDVTGKLPGRSKRANEMNLPSGEATGAAASPLVVRRRRPLPSTRIAKTSVSS